MGAQIEWQIQHKVKSTAIFDMRAVMLQMVPYHNWSTGPSRVISVAIDAPRPSVANHGCQRWSGLATSGPLYYSLIHAINSR